MNAYLHTIAANEFRGKEQSSLASMESRGRADGMLDAEGFFTQSDDEFAAEISGTYFALPAVRLISSGGARAKPVTNDSDFLGLDTFFAVRA